jgi:uncharacterized protein YjbI with pentapeptide repeats
MIARPPTERPKQWRVLRAGIKYRWLLPFLAFEWLMQWAAYGLSRWSLLEVLEYLSAFSILVAVILYFSESGARVQQRHYQAWQVINTAQGKGGSGGRIEALQELNADKVPLVGVDVSSAFLQGIRLEHANLLRSDFSAADLRGSDFAYADFTYADLRSANLRGSSLRKVSFDIADLSGADLVGSDMTGANLSEADLASADLRFVDLKDIQWKQIKSIKGANIAGVKNAPEGFIQWALHNAAIENTDPGD